MATIPLLVDSHEGGSAAGSTSGGDGLETSHVEIPVLVGGTTRWMQGLTRLTTCDDIVYSLLCSLANPAMGDPGSLVATHALYETYGNQERKLSGRTKILRVWESWGSECEHVKYSLRKVVITEHAASAGLNGGTCSGDDGGIPAGAVGSTNVGSIPGANRVQGRREMRMKRLHQPQKMSHLSQSEQRHQMPRANQPPAHVHDIPPMLPPKNLNYRANVQPLHDVRRTVPTHQQQMLHTPGNVSDLNSTLDYTSAMQQLMTLILSQENRVLELRKRIKDIDCEIEDYETNMHDMRVKAEGPDYLQNAYLSGMDEAGASSTKLGMELTGASLDELQDYVDECEKVIQIETQLDLENSKIEDYTLQIQDESFLESFVRSPAKHQPDPGGSVTDLETRLFDELERTRDALEKSVYSRSKTDANIDCLEESLRECDAELAERTIVLNMLEEHERRACDTILEDSEPVDSSTVTSGDDVVDNCDNDSDNTEEDEGCDEGDKTITITHLHLPEPVCSSTPHNVTHPAGHHNTNGVHRNRIHTNQPHLHMSSNNRHVTHLLDVYDPSLTIVAGDSGSSSSGTGSLYGPLFPHPHQNTEELVGVVGGGCKSPGSDTDTTSDTGLSSMHSTTSEDVAYTTLETLV